MTMIKRYREASGLTQEELANRLELSRTAVAMWETGDSLPRADKLPQLAAILGCTIDELLRAGEEK